MQDKYMRLYENMVDDFLKITQEFRYKYYEMKKMDEDIKINLLKNKIDCEIEACERAIEKEKNNENWNH